MLPNIEISTATRGKEGLELIKSLNPDIIILDIQLPDMNGTEICRELRKIESFEITPIIAVTSFAMKGDKERILESGFDYYVSKPLIIKDFKDLIQEIMV